MSGADRRRFAQGGLGWALLAGAGGFQAAALADGLPPRWPAVPEPLHPAGLGHTGWAATPGGRDGVIRRVTSLAALGPGTLAEALASPGPRTVVFEVGGVIDLAGASLRVREPFVTVAGQTAPDPGITLIGGELDIATHDVLIQHLMVRPGDQGRPRRSGRDHDGLTTSGGAARVIVDHCSFSWATDENLSVGGPRFDGTTLSDWRRSTSHDITCSHNLIYEGLADSVHAKGEHSKGTLVHDNATGILLLGNLYACNVERNALFKGGVQAAMVNNLIYNPGARAVHYNLIAHEWAGQAPVAGRLALAGNVLRHGPDTRPGVPLFALGGAGDLRLHLAGNLAFDRHGQPVPQVGRYTASEARVLADAEPYLPPGLVPVSAAALEAWLPLIAGARPWARDPVDFKLLSDVAEDRGRIIDTESQNTVGVARRAATQRPFRAQDWDLSTMAPRAGWSSLYRPASA